MNTKLDGPFLLAFLILALVSIVAIAVWVFMIERRLKKFFLGKNARNLESVIVLLQEEIKELHIAKENIQKDITVVNEKLKKSIRGLHTLRFNPFPDQGSNQSFAIGMLNEEGDGVVLSSLYSRERMSVFAKPIKSGKADYELTAEEKEVLRKAEIK